MIRNYIKIAWRNLVNNKIYSVINISGLGIGLCVCMLIMLYVGHEYSYDRFHPHADRIFRIQGKVRAGNDSIYMPYMSYASGPLTKEAEPLVETYVRFRKENKAIIQNLQNPTQKFAEPGFLFADSNFFSFFNFPLLRGHASNVLSNPFDVVISQQAAERYFGHADPVGKTLRYNNQLTLTVTGVASIPSNSSIYFDFVSSMQGLSKTEEGPSIMSSQMVQLGSFSTYFLMRHPGDGSKLENRLLQLSGTKNKGENGERYIANVLTDVHLKANFDDPSNIKYIKLFPFIAGIILLLALTNYVSLATARSATRAKEVGVRKTMGANRKAIAVQFFIESTLYTTIAFALAFVFFKAFQPPFFRFLQIDIDPGFIYQRVILLSFAGLYVLTIVLAATYPSLLLSAFKPVQVLYGKYSRKSGGASIRKFTTVFQFGISVTLLICGIVIQKQMDFFRNTDTGINREQVLMIPFDSSIGKHYASLKRETTLLAGVQGVSTAHYPMYRGYDIFFAKGKDKNEDLTLKVLTVDENFIPLLDIRWKQAPADSFYTGKKDIVAINQAAVEKLNLGDDPLHEKINFGDEQRAVAGVLKDFNYTSLHQKIDGLCIFITHDTAAVWGQTGGCLLVKLRPHSRIPVVLQQIKTIYERYDNDQPFSYSFMDDAFNAMYTAEDRLSKIFNAFALFTLFIAGIGLFGLATFTAEQRIKEIGIRKVLGASVQSIVTLLSKEFLKLVLLAIVIASPLAWWTMHKWLQDFAYHISIKWWMFALAGFITLMITLITISVQSVKAAVANPVKSLRSE